MTVTVFPTCLIEQLRPDLTGTVVGVIKRAGDPDVRVAAGVTCCGQPAWNAGFLPEAQRVAAASLRALARTEGPIVVPSGSCATMMAEYWPRLLGDRARPTAARVVELSRYLPAPEAASPTGAVTYHDSCHMLRALRIKDEPRRLLAGAGLEVKEMANPERCCGFGGTFSVKLPEVSVAMADEKLDEAAATGASTMVGCDMSCLTHLEGRARRRGMPITFRHIAEVINGG